MGAVTIKVNVVLGVNPQETIVKKTVDAMNDARTGAKKALTGMSDDAKRIAKQRASDEREALNAALAELKANRRKKIADEKGDYAAMQRELAKMRKDRVAAEKAQNAAAEADEKSRWAAIAKTRKDQEDYLLKIMRDRSRERVRIWKGEQAEKKRIDAETDREVRRMFEKGANDAEKDRIAAARRLFAPPTPPPEDGKSGRSGWATALRAGSRGLNVAHRLWSMASHGAHKVAGAFGMDIDLDNAVGRSIDVEAQAVALANQGYFSGRPGDKVSARNFRQNPEALVRQAQGIGDKTGYSTGEILEGLTKFVDKTGDLRSGRDIMFNMARLAKATNTDFHDMIDAAADVSLELGDVQNKGQAIYDVMKGVTAQGKQGAVEIKDLARQMAKIAASAGQYGGNRSANILTMGAFAQEAREHGGAASATMAATSTVSFTAQFSKAARLKAMRALGVNPTDANGDIRDPAQVLIELLNATKGDREKMGTAIADQQAKRITNPFANIYRDAYGEAKGTDEDRMRVATRAVVEELDRLRKATLSEQEIAKSFATAMDTSKTRTQLFNNEMDKTGDRLRKSLMDPLQELAPEILRVANGFADLVRWIMETLGKPDVAGTKRDIKGAEDAGTRGRAWRKILQHDIETLDEGGNVVPHVRNFVERDELRGRWRMTEPQAGRYDPENIAQAKSEREEMVAQLARTKDRLGYEKEHLPQQHINPITGQVESIMFVPSKGKTVPLVHGYESQEDYDRVQRVEAGEKQVMRLEKQISSIDKLFGSMDLMKEQGGLRVFVVNAKTDETGPPSPKAGKKGRQDSDEDLTSHP